MWGPPKFPESWCQGPTCDLGFSAAAHLLSSSDHDACPGRGLAPSAAAVSHASLVLDWTLSQLLLSSQPSCLEFPGPVPQHPGDAWAMPLSQRLDAASFSSCGHG